MGKRDNIKTTIRQAVDYWSKIVDECELSVDWAEADTHCWRCGCEKGLERCHIIPDSLGGEDSPSNIVLLCKRCHIDGPNVTDPEIMWDWIKAYSVPFYNTFWGILGAKEYEFVYKKSVAQEIKDILDLAGVRYDETVEKNIKDIQYEVMANAGIHFGHPYFNTATMAGIHRMTLKKLANCYRVVFPLCIDQKDEPKVPWWL